MSAPPRSGPLPAAAAALLLVAACAPPGEVPPLAPGRHGPFTLGDADSRGHAVHLEEGQLLHLTVEQQGVDLVVALRDPRGAMVRQVDSVLVDWGPEELLVVAGASGSYRLEISGYGETRAAGGYEIEVQEIRAATAEDLERARAAGLCAEAIELVGTDLDEAQSRFTECIGAWGRLGDVRRKAISSYSLGFVLHEIIGDREGAPLHYEAAIRAFESLDEPWWEGRAQLALGTLLLDKGQLVDALPSLKRARELTEETGYRSGFATAANNLGRVYARLREAQLALDNYRSALTAWQLEGKALQKTRTLLNLASLYGEVGKPREGLDLLAQSGGGPEALQGQLHLTRGQLLLQSGEYRPALEALENARRQLLESGESRSLAVALSDLGRITGERGDLERSRELLEEAHGLFSELDDLRAAAAVDINLGNLYLLHQPPLTAEANKSFSDALKTLAPLPDDYWHAQALLGLAECARAVSSLGESRELAERAVRLVDTLRSRPLETELRPSYLATMQRFYQFYVELLMQMHEEDPVAGHDIKAFEASEKARARLLLETLSSNEVELWAGNSLRQEERELEWRILAERERAASEKGATTSNLAKLEARLDDFRSRLGREDPRFAAFTRPHTLTLREIQRDVVDAETILLHYALGERESYLWVVATDSIRSYELPPRAEIENVARYTALVLPASRTPDGLHSAGEATAALSEMILAPAVLDESAPSFSGKRLLIAKDGALHYVPFGVLPIPGSPEAEPKPLVSRNQIVTVASASSLATIRNQARRRESPIGQIAVVADPVFQSHDPRLDGNRSRGATARTRGRAAEGTGFERLAYSGEEARTILGLADEGHSFSALGFDATKEVVLSGKLSEYRFVHFATHGDVDTADPRRTRLVLSLIDSRGQSRDGSLFSREVYGLDLSADLVSLSACETALGEEVLGEGLLGLTQGFHYAGARAVLVSLWKIDDRATAEFMKVFYRNLIVERLDPSRALQVAQEAMRLSPWGIPYYWAGFVLQGDWQSST